MQAIRCLESSKGKKLFEKGLDQPPQQGEHQGEPNLTSSVPALASSVTADSSSKSGPFIGFYV